MSQQPSRFSFYIGGFEVDVKSIVLLCVLSAGDIFCCICKRNRKKVKVVCEKRNAPYSIAFRNFAVAELKYEVIWESKPPNDKYILLVEIESRIPEDVRRAVNELNIKGEIRKDDTLVIGMIHSDGGKPNVVSNYIGNADDPLHHLEFITLYYKGYYPTSIDTNKETGCSIKHFFD